jgi:hypothetical protein
MRVTIEHRETASGVLGNHKDCYIDCRVEFSEEEKAIIKQRDLYSQGVTVRTSTPMPSRVQFFNTNVIRAVGFILALTGIVLGIAGTGFGFLFFVGAGLFIWGFIRTRREDKRFETAEQEITVKKLLANPSFTVHGWNPAAAKGLEQDIREELVSLKNLIQNSAEIQAKQTFEL